MRPVRFARTGYAFAVPGSVTVLAAAVLPEGGFDIPQVNEIDASAFPLPVRWPLMVAVVG